MSSQFTSTHVQCQVYDQPCCPSSHTDYGGVCRYTQCGLNFPSQNSTLPIFFSPSLPLPLSPSLPISLSPYLPLSLPSLPLPPPLPSPHAGSTGQKGGEDKAGEGKVDGDGPRHSTETRGLQGRVMSAHIGSVMGGYRGVSYQFC